MNKAWDKLLEADKLIRRLPLHGCPDSTVPLLRIEFIRGFEIFNTRPYHNYETWGDGYIIQAFDDKGIVIATSRREDLDEALKDILNQLEAKQ